MAAIRLPEKCYWDIVGVQDDPTAYTAWLVDEFEKWLDEYDITYKISIHLEMVQADETFAIQMMVPYIVISDDRQAMLFKLIWVQ